MTARYYPVDFLREVSQWSGAYEKWSEKLDTIDSQMKGYILDYLKNEDFGHQETMKGIIERLPISSTRRLLIDMVQDMDMQEGCCFTVRKRFPSRVTKKINTYVNEYHFCYEKRKQIEAALRNVVLGYMKEHHLEENPMAYKEIVAYLPASFFRFNMYETYYELKEKNNQREPVSKHQKKKDRECR